VLELNEESLYTDWDFQSTRRFHALERRSRGILSPASVEVFIMSIVLRVDVCVCVKKKGTANLASH
jgi:hypothetical protein